MPECEFTRLFQNGRNQKGVALSEPLKKAKSAHLTTRNSVRDRPFTGTTSPLAYCAT